MGCNIWIFFIGSFTLTELDDSSSKILAYLAVIIVFLYVWIMAATGGLGEIRWWLSRDCLSCLVPPSIKNATMTKCRWTLWFY